jgi:hypothetical protein
MTQEKIVKGQRAQRPQRASIKNKGRLVVGQKDPDKEYRFVNDKDGRVDMFQNNGWEVVTDVQIGSRRANVASELGSAASINVGLGDRAVLMAIPKEWYEEDQKAKQVVVDGTEQTIKENALNGHKGHFTIERR